MIRQMKSRLTHAADAMKRLYHCEKGAEGLEKLLIIGAIVIPLLALLIIFRDKITDWTQGAWDEIREDSDAHTPDF